MATTPRQELVPSTFVDAGTGEKQEIAQFPHEPDEIPLTLRDATWNGVVPISKEQEQALRAEPNDDKEIDILPSGEVYMSHVFVRRRLNDAFMQQGGWKLRPMSKVSIDPETNVMYREYALVINGIAVAATYGSTSYQPTNKRMDFADAAEAVRSNALTRLAKDLGVGSECWDRDWCDRWKDRHAVHVFVMVKKWDGVRGSGKSVEKREAHWRKLSRKPFFGEIAPVPDSPNYDACVAQQNALRKLLADRTGKSKVSAGDDVKQQTAVAGEGTTSRERPAPPVAQKRSTNDKTAPAAQATIRPEDRGFYIKSVRASREQRKPHEIEMMDGFIYFSYHKTTHDAMQLLFAKRAKVKIVSENRRAGNKVYPHIIEWKEL